MTALWLLGIALFLKDKPDKQKTKYDFYVQNQNFKNRTSKTIEAIYK